LFLYHIYFTFSATFFFSTIFLFRVAATHTQSFQIYISSSCSVKTMKFITATTLHREP